MLFCHDGSEEAYQLDLLEAIRDSPKARTCLFLPSKVIVVEVPSSLYGVWSCHTPRTSQCIIITFAEAKEAKEENSSSGNLVLEVNTEEQPMPLALMILIPILSFSMILVILAIVCIRRSSAASTASSSLTASPLVKTSDASQNTSVDHHIQASNTTLQTLKRLSSLHHFYAKPWAMSYISSTASANNEATRVPPPHQADGMHDQDMDDDESW